MGKKTKQDPTGQATNRRRARVRLRNRLTRAQKKTRALFRAVPRTRKQKTTLTNSIRGFITREALFDAIGVMLDKGQDIQPLLTSAVIPVYDYQITPEELEMLNISLRRVVNDELLETQFDRMPPNWWWQKDVELPYRQGTGEEIVQFNQLVTKELVRVRTERGLRTQRLEIGEVLLSSEYQQALNTVYVKNFSTIKTLSDRTADQVIQVINSGMSAGMTPTEIGGLINERFDVSKSSATRTANTEINRAYNDARMDANDIAADVTGLRAGVLHLSALLPTTRAEHGERHGNAYTTAQQRIWWDTGANRINCHCSTRSVLIDRNGKVIDTELQEEIQVEREFFDT